MAMSMAEEALEEEASLPAGYRFSPTDGELILFYLHNHPSPIPLSKAVHEISDFDCFTPWTLHGLFSLKRADACYFLTHRKCGGGKPKDNLRTGYWKPTVKDCSISIGAVAGVHKVYTYLQSMYPMSRVSDSYFITRLSRKYSLGCRPKRTTDGGVWKSTSRDNSDKCGNPVDGICRSLVYLKGTERVKTNWLMKEFRLGELEKLNEIDGKNSKEWNPEMLDDVVLCKVYGNKRIKQCNGTKEEPKVGNVEDIGGTSWQAIPEIHTSSSGSDDFSYQSLVMDLLE